MEKQMVKKTSSKAPPVRATKEVVNVYKIQIEGLSELSAALVSVTKLLTTALADLGKRECSGPTKSLKVDLVDPPAKEVAAVGASKVEDNGSEEESTKSKKTRSTKKTSSEKSKQDGVLNPNSAPGLNGMEIMPIPDVANSKPNVEPTSPVKTSSPVDVFDFGD